MNRIDPPEPHLAEADLIARASGLVPTLRERAARCEELGRIPDETMADLLAAGLFRMLQPRRYGGYECSLPGFVQATSEVSRGCGSTGWVLSLTAGHPKWAAFYPPAAQDEIYGQTGDLRFPLVVAPQGRAHRVDGGYRLRGQWKYVSGCDVTNWLALTAAVKGDPGQAVCCLVRRADYEVIDDWFTLGMVGTGSKSAVLDGVFVPDARALPLAGSEPAERARHHPGPLYAGPMMPVFCAEIGAVAVGVAKGAVDAFTARARRKRSPFPPFGRLADDPAARRRLGLAKAKVAAAEATVLSWACDYMAAADDPERAEADEIARAPVLLRQVVELSGDAVTLLAEAAGTSATRTDDSLGRCWRDMQVMRTHYIISEQRAGDWAALALDKLD